MRRLKNLFKAAIKALAAVVFAFALFFVGKAAASKVSLPEIKPARQITEAADVITHRSSYSIAYKYIIALTDSTVKFERLPSYRTDVPWAVISELYDKAEVLSVTIKGLNIELLCRELDGSFDGEALKKSLESVYGISSVEVKRLKNGFTINIKTVA